MKTSSKKSPATKRIYNLVTRSYYRIRTTDTARGNKGAIIGKWHPPKRKK